MSDLGCYVNVSYSNSYYFTNACNNDMLIYPETSNQAIHFGITSNAQSSLYMNSNTITLNSSNVIINGQLTVSNVEYITSNITIYNSETIQSNLSVYQVATLCNAVNIYGATTLSNGLTVYKSTTTLSNAVNIYGATTLSNTLTTTGGTTTHSNAVNIYGNLGIIGAASSGLPLDVNVSSNGNANCIRVITQSNNNPGILLAGLSGSNYIINAGTAGALTVGVNPGDMVVSTPCNIVLSTNSTTASNVYIQKTTGYVGIGTSNPAAKLDVAGTIKTNGCSINMCGGYNSAQNISVTGPAGKWYKLAVMWDPQGKNTFVVKGKINYANGFQTFEAVLGYDIGYSGFRGYYTSTHGNIIGSTFDLVVYSNGSEGSILYAKYNDQLNILFDISVCQQNNYGSVASFFPDLSPNTFTLAYSGTMSSATDTSITTAAAYYYTLSSSETKMTFKGGNVGIGTSNPAYPLDVTGSARINTTATGGILLGNLTSSNSSANGIVQIAGVDSSKAGLSMITTNAVTQQVVTFHNPNGSIGNINLNGSTTSYNTSSDYRLKTNIEPLTDIWDQFMQLNPVTFNFKSDLNTKIQGFIAHEVQEIVPLAVSGEKDAIDEDNNPIYQGMDASKLIPLLVAALKDLKTELVQKNKILEDHIEILERKII